MIKTKFSLNNKSDYLHKHRKHDHIGKIWGERGFRPVEDNSNYQISEKKLISTHKYIQN